jgi:hypothetical protein
MEAAGRFREGFDLLIGDLNARVESYLKGLDQEEEEDGVEVKLSGVEAGLLVVVQYCQRISRYRYGTGTVQHAPVPVFLQ